MSDESSPLVRALQREVRALRQKLEQRDQAFAVLNRRLMALERGEGAVPGPARAGAGSQTAEQSEALRAELERLRATKLFRWSSPARQAYSRLRAATRR